MTRLIERRAASVERAEKLLAAYSYHGVLARGFALVRDLDGHPLRQAAAVDAGMTMDIEFFDAHVQALAKASSGTRAEKPQGAVKHRGRRGGDSGQGSLFG